MEKETFRIEFDDLPVLQGLEKIEAKLAELDKANAAVTADMRADFEKTEKVISGFSDELASAAKGVTDAANAANTAQAANRGWLQSIRQTIAGQQIAGKTLAEWGQQAQAFAERVRHGTSSLQGMAVAQRVLNGVLKASGIGVLAAAVAAAIGYFTRFQSGIDKVAQVTAGFNAVINTLIGRFVQLGSAAVKVFSGDFSGAAADARAAVSGVGAAIVDAATAAYSLERRMQTLRDATINASVETARQRAELEKLRISADDETQSIGRRIESTRAAGAIEQQIAARNLALAAEDLKTKQEQLDRAGEVLANREAEAEAQKVYFEAKAEFDRANLENEAKLRELRKQAGEERRKQLDDERKALEALAKDLQKLRLAALGEGLDAELFAVNQKFDELAKVAADGVDKLNEIEKRRTLNPEELQQRQEFGRLAAQIEEQRLGALLDVITEFNEKEIAIANEQEERKKALAEKDLDRAVKSLENEKKLRDEQINLQEAQNERFLLELENKGAKEEDIKKAEVELDKFVQAARLNNELQFQEALLALTDKGNTEQVQQIEATILTLKQKISNLQIDEPGKKPKNIFELLGIDADGEAAIKEGVGKIIDGINQIAQARVDAAAAEVERIDELIAKREEAVDREAELAKAGLANDLTLEKERLAELKKQRDAAAKEEARARRAQIALDTVQQAVNLITASTSIFKALAPLAPFGVPLAIGLIAAMFGAFVAARARALKAAEAPKLRKGGVLPGRSHEQGGTPIVDRDGFVIAEGEAGEFVLPVGPSKEHLPFLERMRKGEFKGIDLAAMIPAKSGQNPSAAASERIREMQTKKAELEAAQDLRLLEKTYKDVGEKIVEAIQGIPEITPVSNYVRRVKKGNNVEITRVLKKGND